jgi:hypothetical protein
MMRVDHDAEIDHVERIEAEMMQIVVNRLGQFLGRESRIP